MKFQVNILSSSGIMIGDRPSDRPSDRPTIHPTDIVEYRRSVDLKKKRVDGIKYILVVIYYFRFTRFLHGSSANVKFTRGMWLLPKVYMGSYVVMQFIYLPV